MRTVVAAAVACLSLAGLSVAADVQASIKKEVSIPAGGLGPALKALSQERHVHIVFISEDVDKLSTQGASGSLTFDEALSQLLNGTGLTYQHIDAETVSILPTAAAPGATEAAEIPPGKSKGARKLFLSRFRIAQASSPSQGDGSGNAASPRQTGQDSFSEQTIDEIIVTAQKRQERLQDVPISISVLGGEQLDKSSMEGVSDALDSIAGVATIEGINRMGSQVTVRGVGAQNALLFGASPIAYYLDSVPYGFARHSFAPDAGAYDLERVEVLRGPQGTLYGANALNGVVRILTREPDLGEFDLKARTGLSYTRYGSENYRGDMAINVPLAEDKLAARVIAGYQKFGGWIDKPNDDDANESELANVRLKLKAQATDRLTIGFSAIVSRQDYAANSVGFDDRTQTSTLDEPQAADYEVYAGTLTYDFAVAQLTSSTSYMDFRGESALDFGPVAFAAIVRSEFESSVLAHESTLTSSAPGPWKWSAGLFYRDAKDRTYQPVTGYGALQNFRQVLDWNDYSESYAVYGEITREILDDRLEFTGGVRYFKDEVRVDDRLGAADGDAEFDAVSPRVVVTWKQTQDAMAYVSFAKGFRSGVLQVPLATEAGVPPAEPDKLFNYEVGTKISMLDNRMDVEAAVFYIDWQDIMTGGIRLRSPQGLEFSSVTNTVGASGAGFEIAANFRPFEGMAIGVSYGVNDLTFDADLRSGATLLAAKGSRIAYSPKHTANAFTTYDFPLGQGGFGGSIAASVNYVSEYRGGSVTALSDPQTIARISFSILAPQNWEATLFADNLTNEQDRASPSSTPVWAGRPRPRTIGLQLQYDF